MTRILVLGSTGQLGIELVAALTASPGRDVRTPAVDIGDRDQAVGAVCELQPDIVVNCGAYNAVDAAETDVDGAFRTNAMGVRHLAAGCRRVGAHLVHVSTDYVFDGTLERPYVEWDEPNPLSVYGRSKRAGELELDPGATLVRTAWVVSKHRSNLVKTILAKLAGTDELRFVDDKWGCMTAADELAGVVAHLALGRVPGIFHVTNAGATTPFELARQVAAWAGEDAARVQPISTAELGATAPRPRSSVLDNMALRLSGVPPLADHREPLERLVKELSTK